MDLKITVDGKETTPLALAFEGRLAEVLDQQQATLKAAYRRAMAKGVVQPGKRDLRAVLAASGFYRAGNFANTWRGNTEPRDGHPTFEPAAWFENKAGKIITAFEDGVTISVHNAQFLAIPQGPAKAIAHRLNKENPGRAQAYLAKTLIDRVAREVGSKLVPIIDRRKGQGVLVAVNGARVTKGGKRSKTQGKPTVLFVLIRQATLRRRPMGRAVLEGLKGSFLPRFAAALAAELPPENR